LSVRAPSKSLAEAVIRANPGEYVGAKFVKVLVSVGPSLDSEVECSDEGSSTTLHEIIGESAEQDWLLPLKTRVMRVSRDAEIAPLVKMRGEGLTFEEIAEKLGRKTEAVKKSYYRNLKKGKAA
jgi:hypothetical protein